MVYVMSDIHGQYQTFLKMLSKINFKEEDILYILGDIIDRGPDSFEIYDYIKDKPNIIMIMGNHEKMMSNYFNEKLKKETRNHYYYMWLSNGGYLTEKVFLTKSKEEQEEIKEYLASLPYYKIVEVNNQKYLLCHAIPIIRPNKPILDEIELNIESEDIIWGREFINRKMNNGYKVIHGHTPVQYAFGVDKIVAYNDGEYLNIDCGCAISKKLSCLRLDDFTHFYVNVENS